MIAQSLSPGPQQWMVLTGLGILICLWIAVKLWTRPRGPRGFGRSEGAVNRQTEEVRDDLAALLTELQRLSANINAQLDDKYARLGDAVRDADQRIFALRALAQAAENPVAAPASEPPAPPTAAESLISRVHELSNDGLTAQEIAARLEHPIGEVQLILNLRTAAARPQV